MTQAHDDDRANPDIWSASRQMNAIETSMWRAEVDPRLRSTVCALLILDSAPDWGRLREAHEWAVGQSAEVVHDPREFPEYGVHYATFFLDPHGFMLEVVCHRDDES